MSRFERILQHPVFQDAVRRVAALEQNRRYCRHGLAHLLDVCRIAYVEVLEQRLDYPKDVVYAAGLLHDVGKYRQYEDGTPHNLASAEIAGQILQETAYSTPEQQLILDAIVRHRAAADAAAHPFSALLYRADKASRACFLCTERASCDWDEERKNNTMRI